MQTIQFTVNDNYLQIVISLLKNLKQGIIEDLSISTNDNKKSNNEKEIEDASLFFDKFQIDMSNYSFNREEANAR